MKELDSLPEILTVDEVAAFLRIDRRTVTTLIKSGQLHAAWVGSRWRITRVAVGALVGIVPGNDENSGPKGG